MASDSKQRPIDVTKRITVTLDDKLHDWIAAQAGREERTVPNYLAWLARKAYLEGIEADSLQKSVPVATK